MTPHSSATVIETTISRHWLDSNGIVCSVSKPGERTLSKLKETVKIYAQLTADKKCCLIVDSSHTGIMNKEMRDYISAQLPKFFKAMAVISNKPLHATLANVFLKFSWKRFPIKLFTSEKEAREWLREYL
ncbi:MAG: hypothetical protein IPP32_08445 [Bacteroidetes bacterium]|nr:hypothetical protein [Bacteroidota bacterium]